MNLRTRFEKYWKLIIIASCVTAIVALVSATIFYIFRGIQGYEQMFIASFIVMGLSLLMISVTFGYMVTGKTSNARVTTSESLQASPESPSQRPLRSSRRSPSKSPSRPPSMSRSSRSPSRSPSMSRRLPSRSRSR